MHKKVPQYSSAALEIEQSVGTVDPTTHTYWLGSTLWGKKKIWAKYHGK